MIDNFLLIVSVFGGVATILGGIYKLVKMFHNVMNKIEDVECFKGKYIFIDETDKLQLPKDTYYITDLIGSKVIDNATNNEIGIITDVFSTGSNDVYVVKTLDKEILLPAIKQVILNIDINEKGEIKGLF